MKVMKLIDLLDDDNTYEHISPQTIKYIYIYIYNFRVLMVVLILVFLPTFFILFDILEFI